MSNSKAVFLDRDGVINEERKDYVKTVDELIILPNVAKLIHQLKYAGFLVVVITNQSAVNRGYTNHENVQKIHAAIQEHLKQNGTFIDAFYYCPHRPDENCLCRKPKPGLLLKAITEFDIDISASWMIGNSESDIQAAQVVGCNAMKVESHFDLNDAIQNILHTK